MYTIKPTKTAHILVDYQNDFVDKRGALYVRDAEIIAPTINALINTLHTSKIPTIATKDWHPKWHISFASRYNQAPFSMYENNMVWPDHCVQNTWWAEYYQYLDTHNIHQFVLKAHDIDKDSYSWFWEPNLNLMLKQQWYDTLLISGVATDYCVAQTSLDAVKLWYKTFVVSDCIKAVAPDTEIQAIQQCTKAGITFITSNDLLQNLLLPS